MDVNGKRAVVLGLGISGMEAAKLLQDKGAQVTVRDNATTGKVVERATTLRQRGVQVELGPDIQSDARFDFGVLSPGINPAAPLVETLHQAGLPMFGELELAYRFCECPIVAITGTNGKTTTTELVQALLSAGGKRALASGNIGTAFSTAVRQSADLDVMVLEVSSFQLENIVDFRPRISVHLNLTPDHLDRYATMEDYAYAKRQVFRNQTVDDYAENMLAALAVADLYEIPRDISIQALCKYPPLPHRCEKVAEIDGVLYLNDSKATNIDALEKALIAMHTPVVLLAGGKDKGLDFTSLRPLLREKVRAVVLIGQMTDKLAAAWSSAVPCHKTGSLAEAVAETRLLAHRGDTVLFSPGCSSYDMFKSFEDRGDQFRELVKTQAAQPLNDQ
jgi:UDP-N-acetylmuramoylalanine--D-glutamate ligase